MSLHIKYTLIAKVHGEKGIVVADYFETYNYHMALENLDDMLTEAKHNQFGFAGKCEVIFTKTMYDSDDRMLGSDQFKFRVHGEGYEV